MSDRRKLGPVRQLSLQTDTRRPLLKKQLSVEHLESIEEHKLPSRNIESAKTNKLSDRPRPIRVAWAESRQLSKDEPPTPKSRFGDPVEIKKCKEHKRPVTAKLRPQLSVEKESILYTRQELAERLRKAWKDREDNKQNLDIFLAHNVQERHFDDDFEDNEVCYDKKVESPKEELVITVPKLQPQKTVQKQKSVSSEFSYIPSTTANRPQDVRTNISVTIPTVINQKHQDNSQPDSLENKTTELPPPPETEHKLVKQASLINKENESIIKTLPSRPSTAASKRESFQKRTNTAFTGSVTTSTFRPPLARTLSVPVKSDGNKLKFIASKRRLKSARRKGKDEEPNSEGEGEEDGEKTTKKGSRCKSAPGGELVTMVSLVSPAGSDNEEQDVKKEEKSRSASPVKNTEPVKTPALRKTAKSVSFQQSSIHSVRSFSASFPSRRSVMSAMSSGALASSEREKRAPVESPPGLGETRGPKRRLVRAVSVAGDDVRLGNHRTSSFDDDSNQDSRSKTPLDIPGDPKQTIGVTRAEIHPSTKKQNSTEKNSEDSKENDGTAKEDKENTEENEDPSIPKFESNKERDCWIMYKKMSDKGLPVSYDTILRGMLTPTEYRSVRKEIKSSS